MVEDVARQRLAACPGKGPERRGDIAGGEVFFRCCPDGRELIGLMHADRQAWNARHASVGADKGNGVRKLALHSRSLQIGRPSSLERLTTCRLADPTPSVNWPMRPGRPAR